VQQARDLLIGQTLGERALLDCVQILASRHSSPVLRPSGKPSREKSADSSRHDVGTGTNTGESWRNPN
jgi:hypothetical protein